MQHHGEVEICNNGGGGRGMDEITEDSWNSDGSEAEDASPWRRARKVQTLPSTPSTPLRSSPSQDNLAKALEAVLWSCGDIFVTRGWEVTHISGDRYSINGRNVKLTTHSAGNIAVFSHNAEITGLDVAERAAQILVCDGSLRQPLLDYLLQNGKNESYDQRGTENVAGATGLGKYLDFNVAPTGDRIVEMNQATFQAQARQRAGAAAPQMTSLQFEGQQLLIRPKPPRMQS